MTYTNTNTNYNIAVQHKANNSFLNAIEHGIG